MLSTPLMKVRKNLNTVFVMWFLMFLVYVILVLTIFPLYYQKQNVIITCLSFFTLTFILHIISLNMDPGYLKKPINVPFIKMLEEFDPVDLCPDCEVIRTEKSRHCSVCNRCVERFDHHCPWINNCVGTNNHGAFVSFLISMESLLLITIAVLFLNMDCHKNMDIPRS